MYYAQINEDGICYAVTQTAGAIEQSDMMPIDAYDESLLGKRRVGDVWEDVPEPEPEESEDPESNPQQPQSENRIGKLEEVIDTLLGGEEEWD